MRIIPKEVETLWTLFTAPVIWAGHFLACYALAAIWCAKRGDLGFAVVQAGIVAMTLAALAMIVLSGWLAWRQWGFGTNDPPHDDPTATDRNLFQGFATLLLCGLSFVAVLYVGLPLLFIDGCSS
ncbi:MAG: hypothetical protein E5Y74_24655 [Mesorhizobium sp.]|uniref:hypothetical protein n=1 Tax=unclassified Mesorhizobium TaxID=325217 RepID=UPI000FCB1E1F|nr:MULTISPECIES: hypothetical protein [unclassified Mesorhizobium]AZV23489.1 hypothetical protein EJ079_32915 [Mesorhizobium sp. M7A.F.Ce.TU.012.03.2.1]RUU94011.1 hypothetical protein EOB59_00705 [Mesorhizobium sp. M7A.F.Ca.MR.176.00.0.0]RVD16640.1 hypothetical protein EN749_11685 [Mesorhizobium sp. M7A.F.Ca.ET.027.02.1.1]RVD62347.1 hypothetical protein EN750_21915 [Mesorhizobium sp. M7A.F.Ca.ET.027.03.2.1]RWD14304.1 MAG: hypothetical protein EOS73_01720 [Mesorhizobium sp.]